MASQAEIDRCYIILEKLGHIINDYFEYITPENEEYNLCVDDFLFDTFLDKLYKQDKITKPRVYVALRTIECFFNSNEYVALAIAAYQVVVFYTLDATTTSDAYNEKLFNSTAYNGFTYQQYWYGGDNEAPYDGYALQERMWALIKSKFRIGLIPEHMGFGARDRYVQYPKSQNILGSSMRTFRIRYADKFIQLNLQPNQVISFDKFQNLVFPHYFTNKMLKRLVFAFYNMWDGRSYHQILENISNETLEQRAKDEFLIQLQPKIRLFINRQEIDPKVNKIDNRYLWHFSEMTNLTTKATIFIKDSDYNDWMPVSSSKIIDPDEDLVLLTNMNVFPSYIEEFVEENKIEIINIGLYKILLLQSLERKDFETLGINIKPIQYFMLVGGLKIKRNTYYDFALPSIKLTDEVEDNNTFKSLYIDSKEYNFENVFLKIPEDIGEGKHYIKLLNSWDSSEVYFNVEKAKKAELPYMHGWKFDLENLTPAENEDDIIIDGLQIKKELTWIERDYTDNSAHENFRGFVNLQNKLNYRYERIGNKKLMMRERYGN